MVDTPKPKQEAEVTAAPVAVRAKKARVRNNTTTGGAAGGGKRQAQKSSAKTSTHPPASEMVLVAVTALGERKGSSLQAIKKYIANNFDCDVVKWAFRIRKALTSGVENGKLIRTKGTGASGSFKLKVDPKKPAVSAAAPAGGKKARKTAGPEGETQKKKKKKETTTSRKPAGGGDGKGSKPKPKVATASGRKSTTGKAATSTTTTDDDEGEGVVVSKQKTTKPSKTASPKAKLPMPKKTPAVAEKKVAGRKK